MHGMGGDEAVSIFTQLRNLQMLEEARYEATHEPRDVLRRVHYILETAELEPDDRRSVVMEEAQRVLDEAKQPEPTRGLISDYITARLSLDEQAVAQATQRISELSRQRTVNGLAPALSQEITAYLFLAGGDEDNALDALLLEGAHEDAITARQTALEMLALDGQTKRLATLITQEKWRASIKDQYRHEIGVITGDLWLQWTGILLDQWQGASVQGAILGLLSAALWYVVLVRYGERTRFRWAWPILPLLAGVASIWLTLMLLDYQERHLGMEEADTFPADLIYEVVGVGAREEVAKLLCFALFLPWLLKKRQAGLATLTGAFVGLGFSLEENIGAGADTWGRLLTASFLHLALTGLTGNALYEMLRSRFAQASSFLATLASAIVLHGLYNWAPGAAFRVEFGEDLDLVSLILLGALAHQFYSLLAQHLPARDGTISTTAIFILGSAFLVAFGFIMVALEMLLWQPVTLFGMVALGYVPIAVFHVRKLHER
jgi:protease PrsW